MHVKPLKDGKCAGPTDDTNGPRDGLRYTHAVIIVLDAECDRQATVVGRLLTTLGDSRRDITK